MGYHGRMKAEMSFKDKLIDYRNRHRRLNGKGSKGRYITRLAETFGLERKYLIKLLNGQREFKPPRCVGAHAARRWSGWRVSGTAR